MCIKICNRHFDHFYKSKRLETFRTYVFLITIQYLQVWVHKKTYKFKKNRNNMPGIEPGNFKWPAFRNAHTFRNAFSLLPKSPKKLFTSKDAALVTKIDLIKIRLSWLGMKESFYLSVLGFRVKTVVSVNTVRNTNLTLKKLWINWIYGAWVVEAFLICLLPSVTFHIPVTIN